jgi:putative tryptophan/tyrosine transport system substrate-binding protein
MIGRREFITFVGSAAAWPGVARAQQPAYDVGGRRRTHRIAVIATVTPIALMTESSPNLFFREFFVELRRLGYVEGENLVVHRFSTEGHAQRNSKVVTATIRSAPDVIFAFSSRMVKLLKDATTAIPIVGYTADPVSFGIVTSLARPGGNVTGISTEAGVGIEGKRLDLFKEIMPTASRLAVLAPVAFWNSPYGSAIRMLAGQLGFIVVGRPLADPVDEAEFRSIFAELQRDKADVVLVPDAPENNSNQQLIVEFTERAHLPTITSTPQFVKAGSLMSYGPDAADLVRRAARYVDEVLRGTKPADLPVLQPTKFELVINLKTAKALGLTVPETLLATANQVIE